jgi:hypothetical protein
MYIYLHRAGQLNVNERLLNKKEDATRKARLSQSAPVAAAVYWLIAVSLISKWNNMTEDWYTIVSAGTLFDGRTAGEVLNEPIAAAAGPSESEDSRH